MPEHRIYQESVKAVTEKIEGLKPEILMILGSGLSSLADMAKDTVSIPYEEIPGFKASTAPGHFGKLVIGTLGNKCVMIMQGRMHYYEGYGVEEITYPVRVARLLGAEKLIVTNAAGGVNGDFEVGDIMLIRDHIKLFGDSPLRGKNIDTFGVRFPDMTYAYSRRLRDIARGCAEDIGVKLREGVYFYMTGPQYETPAEINAIRILGADAVGMSTVPEVICAAHAGMEVLGFSLISNMASGILDKPLTCEEVMAAGEAAREVFGALILKCLERM
jgi:purine-nucleoside phosphorylase